MKALATLTAVASLTLLGACSSDPNAAAPISAVNQSRNGWSADLIRAARAAFVEGSGDVLPDSFVDCAMDYIVRNWTPGEFPYVDQDAVTFEIVLLCGEELV